MPTNFTPLTTRPLSTSRQGMMRLARPMLLSELIREFLRLGEIEAAFIQRATDHRAHHALACHFAQFADVVQTAHAAGGDHRHGDGARQRHGGVDVDAAHHAVAVNVGIHDGLHAFALEALGDVNDVMVGQLRPAIDRHFAVAGVEPRHEVAGKFRAGVTDEVRHVHRIGAEDHVIYAHRQIELDGLVVADPAADLDGHVGMRLGAAADGVGIDGFAGEGAVETDDVQPAGARRHPAGGHRHRVVGKHRVVLHAPLAQAHAFTVFEIYGGYQQHKASLKLRFDRMKIYSLAHRNDNEP